MTQHQQDEFFMRRALDEAAVALEADEVPIGAVVVMGDRIVGRGHNLVETLTDATAHAEMQAITAAAAFVGGKYLSECTLYVTLEPCAMCAAAAGWSQIGRIVWGAADPKRGFMRVGRQLLHPKTETAEGVLAVESEALLQRFFSALRV